LRDGMAKNLEEAEAMALRDAVQFRFDLVKAGKIRKLAQCEIQSGVVGVKWSAGPDKEPEPAPSGASDASDKKLAPDTSPASSADYPSSIVSV